MTDEQPAGERAGDADTVVRVERDESVGIIRLDRPPVNAINTAMHGQIEAAARTLDTDPEIRAVVVHGGERAFAAGADIKEMAELGPAEIAIFASGLTRALDAVARIRVPVVAAVTGYALGGGFELALAADFRVMADDAVVGLPEITLGVIPGAGGTQRLSRLIGATAAKRMIFSGKPVRAEEAVRLGIAEVSVPADEAIETAMTMARQYASGPTAALTAAKRCIDDGLDTDLATGLRMEAAAFAALFATEDQRRGMRTFLAEGPGKATFTGR